MDELRMGIIGVGNMGTTHVNHLMAGRVPQLKAVAVADIDPARLQWVQAHYPTLARFSSAQEMMASGLLDAVIVATPHELHPPLVMEALRQGLHVMCEKPAGVYTKAVREMNEFAAKSDKVFAIMFNQRTNCVYRKMKEIVDSGDMGRIRRVNWIITDWYRSQSYYDSGAWRATWAGEGGGVLLNQCPHNLDLLQWICGLPQSVRAFTHNGKWHDIEVEDDVTAYLEFANGATGVFVTTTGDCPGTNRLEIAMDGGKLVCDGEKLWQYRLDVPEPTFSATYTGGFGTPNCEVREVMTDGENPQHDGVLRAFAAHILLGEPLVAPGQEGIRGLMLSNAMHLSSWLNETVQLPLDEELFLRELNARRATSRYRPKIGGVTFSTENTY